ncbi:MAG: hypothetical protein GXX85_14220 [Ignavibacteria bacterium]|jgi:hypothetical protein|nr:hypothetical protein [Ignavibacteria bacterium]
MRTKYDKLISPTLGAALLFKIFQQANKFNTEHPKYLDKNTIIENIAKFEECDSIKAERIFNKLIMHKKLESKRVASFSWLYKIK